MAHTGKIDDALIRLEDCFTGFPQTIGEAPRESTAGLLFSNPDHHNVTAPQRWRPHTKICYWDPNLADWTTWVYMQVGSEAAGHPIVAGSVLGLEYSSGWTGKLTGDATAVLLGGPACIAPADVDVANYGWFQCGGRIAATLETGLDGDYATDGSVAALSGMMLLADDGACAFGVQTAGFRICGYAGAADTDSAPTAHTEPDA